MSKTNVTLYNMPVSTTLVISGTTYRENLGKITLQLDEGTHTGTITFAGNSSDIKLVVPKSNADQVAEQVQAQVDAAVATATQGMKTQSDIDAAVTAAVATATAGLKTPEQVAAEVQAALDAVVEVSQGYIKIDELKEETNYKDGQHFDETTTKLKLTYSVDVTKTPTATKVKVTLSDDTTDTHDITAGTVLTEYVRYEVAAGGLAVPTVKKIEVLAGNNKVIDELNLSNIFIKGAVPECPKVKYTPIYTYYSLVSYISGLKPNQKYIILTKKVNEIDVQNGTFTTDATGKGVYRDVNAEVNLDFLTKTLEYYEELIVQEVQEGGYRYGEDVIYRRKNLGE